MLSGLWGRQRRPGARGFTLIELVVVLAILGILLALAVPRYLGAHRRAYKKEGQTLLQELKTLSWAYYQERNVFTSNLSALGFAMPSGASWNVPSGTPDGSTVITWTLDGASGTPVQGSTCSVILSADGSASQGCTF
ncbi:MAG: prepilin-type N-terminal cleavage/methylation domain-containing protein [Armatimonadota bacterium]|nr:prepilin-type N-terminal cleavage/methylation domain-containing protein [Armatimonadota bacterium]MDR7486964.1 prepilin-type N-terminal cleavage/methylation domain-containing protein [Armatimonadota bacterium]MDR7532991.1 prepilin-type N-terminal cleavage/methylation domain-containing protein [Armatimonadota bacterium]MDR7537593.1 prepilin-type N-terminal cleavage/methylation domain-containing protein [Armatimonadota bacterium]